MIVMPHASTPSPMFAFMVPPAAMSAVAYSRTVERETARARTFSDAQGGRFRSENGGSQRAASGALEQLGDGREGALPGHVGGAGVVLVAQAGAGAGAQQALHQRRIAVAAGDDEGGVTELVLRVLVGVPGEQLLDDLHGARAHREQQRGVAARGARFEPRALFEHEIHDRRGPGSAGRRKRALAGGIGVVDAGAVLQEQAGGLAA